jgi:PAS domain S-box-containing protein
VAARILIIDDNENLAQNLRDVLEGTPELDAEVVLAYSGHDGLAAARAHGFDVAVLDVKLPDASGVDLIRPLRAAAPRGEIILVTGFATVDAAIAALQNGAFAFLLKSFRPEELISRVQQALEKITLKRERDDFQRRARMLIDAVDVLILALDDDGAISLFNARFSALTGLSAEQAIGRSLAELIEDSDKKKLEHAFVTARDGEDTTEVEVGVYDTTCSPRRVRFHLSGAPGVHDASVHVYVIGIDVTERRALERRAAAAEALNAMAPLALGLAHEIRNPLNAAVLQLELLSRSIDQLGTAAVRDPMRSRVDIVKAEIGRLSRLLTEFLELARPRAPHREPVDLARVVVDMLELEAEALSCRSIRVVRDLSTSIAAFGDVEKLKQVVLNLIVNALDAMPEGGTLSVAVGQDAENAWIRIDDTGPGVDPAIVAEIFDPFFTTKSAGTGLGLAIVRKIIEQLGGRVHIETQPGRGTTAHVTLPRA